MANYKYKKVPNFISGDNKIHWLKVNRISDHRLLNLVYGTDKLNVHIRENHILAYEQAKKLVEKKGLDKYMDSYMYTYVFELEEVKNKIGNKNT